MEVYSNRIASQPFILVRRIPYEEPYHIQLEIVVSSGMFRGSTDLYCGVQQLEELGAALQKFPAKIGDDYRFEYGSEDPEKQSYRHFVLRAYTVGSTGNCALQIRINQNRQEPEEGECRFSIEAEAAAVNRLGRLFTVFSRLEHLELRWSRQEDTLYPEYHLWDVPSAVISMDSMPHHHPEAPAASSPVNNSWDPKAYAEKMKKGKGDVSAFFLIDSPEAVSQCIRWLTVLKPYGMPEMEQSQYFADVREIYRAGRKLINFDYDFTLTHEGRTYPAKLRCHFMEPGKYEIELWLTGFIAAGIEDQFTDGHTGFFCAFMPPAFYD